MKSGEVACTARCNAHYEYASSGLVALLSTSSTVGYTDATHRTSSESGYRTGAVLDRMNIFLHRIEDAQGPSVGTHVSIDGCPNAENPEITA